MEIGEGELHLLSLLMAVGREALEQFVTMRGPDMRARRLWLHKGTDASMSVIGAVKSVHNGWSPLCVAGPFTSTKIGIPSGTTGASPKGSAFTQYSMTTQGKSGKKNSAPPDS